MELVIIIILILLNGIFAMSEMSLVSSRRFKLESAVKKGNSGAKKAIELSDNPTKFLSTVQIGITLIGILLGVYSGDKLTNNVVEFLNGIEVLRPYSESLATVIIVIFITYLSIVLGELLPKRIGMTFPEPIITALSKPMSILSKITSPFVWLLSVSNNGLLKLMGIKKTSDSKVSEEEIKAIIKESAEGGEIQDIEQDIVERVFELGDRKVNSLYTHRTNLVYFDLEDSWETIIEKINDEKHSAYPLVRNSNLDEILGIVLVKDLLANSRNPEFSLEKIAKTPIYATEGTSAYKILEEFKSEGMHYSIVIDEYGSTKGILTMDDVVDALIGDATEIGQEEFKIVQRDEHSWLVDGQFSLVDFAKDFNLEFPMEIHQKYTTVAGLFLYYFHEIPSVGDTMEIGDYHFEVMDKDNHRIDKLLVTRISG